MRGGLAGQARLQVTDSQFDRNSAVVGGVIYFQQSGSMAVTGSTVSTMIINA